MKSPTGLDSEMKTFNAPTPNVGGINPSYVVRIIIGIILLMLLAHIGFYKTYISHFNGFEDYVRPDGRQVHFTWIMHFHGMMMIGWLLMLLVQPFLINCCTELFIFIQQL